MNALKLFVFASLFSTMAALPGCADADQKEEPVATEEGALEQQQARPRVAASDDAIKAKLAEILRGVQFMSESDYPYTIIEADGHGTKRLSSRALRKNLADVIKDKTDDHRDITRRGCRAEKLSISDAVADANITDPEDRDSKQAGLAVKYMTEQLKSVVGYTFGTNESGDQDEFGTVVYVYVGISRTTGKLIGIITQAVYT